MSSSVLQVSSSVQRMTPNFEQLHGSACWSVRRSWDMFAECGKVQCQLWWPLKEPFQETHLHVAPDHLQCLSVHLKLCIGVDNQVPVSLVHQSNQRTTPSGRVFPSKALSRNSMRHWGAVLELSRSVERRIPFSRRWNWWRMKTLRSTWERVLFTLTVHSLRCTIGKSTAQIRHMAVIPTYVDTTHTYVHTVTDHRKRFSGWIQCFSVDIFDNFTRT